MKKLSLLLIIFLTTLAACTGMKEFVTGTKVLHQTEDSAIVEADGSTKARAVLKAQDRARKIFEDFTETKEPSCSERITANPNTGQIFVDWVCTIYVEKKK